ncbi:kinase-like domain-containing protein [Clohesyomyces aquaticus]|uniref:Kinase-like domain-containing protein n=1 Tax=Clohesyomyces aquaticus TaxID=1231657 RepID=A0A1Y1YRV7_9PLEO|nr:kinase-like domain-containing protein [Clohesyomyces aquaticus]
MAEETALQGDRSHDSGNEAASDSVLPASQPFESVLPDVRVVRTVSPGPNDWHPEGLDSLLLYAPHKKNSSSGPSSLIQDGGDGTQLSENPEIRNGVLYAPNDFYDQAGSQFSRDDTENLKSSISELSLQYRISKARIQSLDKDRRFLPLDSLGNLVTPESIQDELRSCGLREFGDLRSIAEEVLKITPDTKPKDRTTRRKIFAILVMMRKAAAIIDVMAEGIYDDDLPFQIDSSPEIAVYRRKREGKALEKILFFDDWEIDQRDSFNTYQWQMTSPYFKLSWKLGKQVFHHALEPQAILPFVEETHKESNSGNSTEFSGGTSTVRKLKIHRAHHNAYKGLTNPYFAVKTLRLSEKAAKSRGKDLNREALALKRFVDKDHAHLIRLLATFSHKDHFHFIFPCAEGNLLDFWEKYYPNVQTLPRDSDLAKWLAEQLYGLACAVKSIHKAPVDDATNSGLPKAVRDKDHGRHGDLKPENILWFRDSESQSSRCPMGVLKISDFGFADFHRTHSVNVISLSSIGGVTPTYRAPEYEIAPNAPKVGLISPSYDIWSFGCILLEFSTWYLLGWEGVDDFSAQRADDSDSRPDVKEDNFFNFYENGRKAKSKKSVAKNFKTLREHPNCKDFMLDLLECIEERMLRMVPTSRSTCNEIVEELGQIMSRCEDSRYCTERIKAIQKTFSDLSMVEVVEYSLPRADEPRDPINVVSGVILPRSGNQEQDDQHKMLAPIVYSSPRAVMSGQTERNPLLNKREMREQGLSVRIYQGIVNWGYGIFAACCCLTNGEVR